MDGVRRLVPSVVVGLGAGAAFGFGSDVVQLAIVVPFIVAPGRGLVSIATAVACASTATLPAGLAAFDYTGSFAIAAVAWAVPAGITGLVLGAALAAPRVWRPVAIGIAIVALSSPPLSSIVLVSPLPLAGLLFPGLGLLGLACLVTLLAAFSVRRSNAIAGASVACLVASAALTSYATSEPVHVGGRAGIAGMDTSRGQPDAETTALLSGVWRREERIASDALDVTTVLWPESVYGEWTRVTGAMLTLTAATVIGGARRYVEKGTYVNTLVNGKTGDVLYAQRTPVPLLIAGRHHAVGSAVLDESERSAQGGIRALLCIEIANPWLAISTFRAAVSDTELNNTRRRHAASGGVVRDERATDNVVVWAANLGWSTRPGLERRMRETASQWSRLFDVPLITAINRAEPTGA